MGTQVIDSRALAMVMVELERTAHRPLPVDPVRRVALVCEESGEAIKAVLDQTRVLTTDKNLYHRKEVYRELVQTAAMALRVLMTMDAEDSKE